MIDWDIVLGFATILFLLVIYILIPYIDDYVDEWIDDIIFWLKKKRLNNE